jgi:hypothetical protein
VRWGRGIVAPALAVAALAGCGRGVSLPDADAYPAPVPAATREDPADSLQLEAVPVRDTAGLPSSEASADTALLAAGLAALQAAVPGVRDFDRISIYHDSLFLGFAVPDQPGRGASASYFPDGRLHVSDPSPAQEETFTLDGVDVTAPERLVRAIEARFPGVHVTDVDLRVGLSYDFGLVWYLDLADARGDLATVFADPDGTVVAVDAD